MRKRKIVLGSILTAFALASITSCNNKSNSADDNNTGGNNSEYTPSSSNADSALASLDYSMYYDGDLVSLTEAEKNTTPEIGTSIDLSSLKTGDYEGYSLSKKGKLTISVAGVYELKGDLAGCVSVDALAGDVVLVLNGCNITVPDTNASAAIVFKGSDTDSVGARIITVKEGTTNTLSDSVYDTEANDGDEAVIQAKKNASLSINGSGKLILNAKGEASSGIKLKERFVAYGADIEVTANKNGIKSNKLLLLYDSNITVNALNDGIKTDMEPETADEATAYASDYKLGYMYINNTNLDITSGDDGIAANNCLYIDNTEANTINVVTNGGAPSTVTEKSSDAANGKAIKVGGIELVSGTTETDYAAKYTKNYGLVITGGNYNINSNSDAVSSKGNTIITGGTFTIASGDDGIHSEYATIIVDGNIKITKSYEGIEGASVEILGGDIDLVSVDDGINAANGDLSRYSFSISILGGNIHVNAQGDGLDSNGTLTVSGGTLIVDGPSTGANASLDSENGITINGGNVVSVGCNTMVEKPSTSSKQNFVTMYLTSNQQAGTTIKVYDSDGKTVLYEGTSTKAFQSVILSFEEFTNGNTYIIYIGSTKYEAKITSTSTVIGTETGMGGGGFGPGGGRPGGR